MSLVSERGIRIDDDQAQELNGLLAGTPGSQHALDRIAGGRAGEVHDAVREAFVDALGSSLKLSAALVAVGLALTVVLMRRSAPADAERTPPVPAPAHPRPAPRRMNAA